MRPGRAAAVMSVLVGVAFGLGAWSAGAALPEGLRPYSPTKLEWAAVELQGLHGSVFTPGSVGWTFLPEPPDTVHVALLYDGSLRASSLADTKDAVRQIVKMYREGREWPWLKVRITEHPQR